MIILDWVQGVVAFVALVLQIWATVLARPLRSITPVKLWRVLILLNLSVLARRILSIAEIVFHWQNENYASVAVTVGLAVSIFMVVTIVMLREHLDQEIERKTKAQKDADEGKQIALATLELAKQAEIEDSAAYKLAMHFVEQHKTDSV